MQYITKVQFELLRKALWTSAIDLRVYDYPQLCYASITFAYDGEIDTSESALKARVALSNML
eukprot:4823263-Amphidinium_carterae.2